MHPHRTAAGRPARSGGFVLPDGVTAVDGAVDLEHGDGWVQPWRLPRADLELHHPLLAVAAMGTSGVRLRCTTASRHLALHVQQVTLASGPAAGTPPPYALVVDGEPVREAPAPDTPLTDAVVDLPDLPPGEKQLEIWLPVCPGVRIRALHAVDGRPVRPPAPDRRPRWTVYGSSITQGHGVAATGSWPAVAARLLGLRLGNLGYGGACLLDPLVARLVAEQPADRITLEIGINVHNSAALRDRTLGPALHGFLAAIRDRRPEVPVTVISPVFGGELRETTADSWFHGPGGVRRRVSGDLTLQRIREVLAEAVAVRRARGDHRLTYLDGRELFAAADARAGLMPDGLHPDAAGQRLMGERWAALLQQGEPMTSGHHYRSSTAEMCCNPSEFRTSH
ncbi:GDSL-type esterase/lipase family protein [Streptacidiphilus griseoplanus]|uniref:GDSL-type esterase/lipase family protein n=1 Tax=Peterkaempfera griseoplana TaxID=66896 RepID=UPI0006E1F8F1|nr:GDSL-type esterase/lipase family protein [Peterkaempfera griseoplana]